MTPTALARTVVWKLLFETDTFKRFISSFIPQNFT